MTVNFELHLIALSVLAVLISFLMIVIAASACAVSSKSRTRGKAAKDKAAKGQTGDHDYSDELGQLRSTTSVEGVDIVVDGVDVETPSLSSIMEPYEASPDDAPPDTTPPDTAPLDNANEVHTKIVQAQDVPAQVKYLVTVYLEGIAAAAASAAATTATLLRGSWLYRLFRADPPREEML